MKQLLMCYPKYFDVLYDINPWMTHQIGKVSSDIAVKQWTSLFDKLNSLCYVIKRLRYLISKRIV